MKKNNRIYLASLFLSSFLAFLFILVKATGFNSYYIAALAISTLIILAANHYFFSIRSLAISLVLLVIYIPLAFILTYLPIILMHLMLLSIGLFFIYEESFKRTFQKIALPGDLPRNIAWGIGGFLALVMVSVILNLALSYLHLNDAGKVFQKLETLPLYILVFAVVAAPFTEEIFFRAFLTERFGVLLSSLIFSAAHVVYGSVIEIVGTFILGILLALLYKKSKSVTPCIVTHFLYNLFSLLFLRYALGGVIV